MNLGLSDYESPFSNIIMLSLALVLWEEKKERKIIFSTVLNTTEPPAGTKYLDFKSEKVIAEEVSH